MKILLDFKTLGYSISLEGEKIRLRYLGIGEQPSEAGALIEELKSHKAEAVEYLRQAQPLPYFDLDGSIIIPFGSDYRFFYWRDGQSIQDTEKEVRGLLN